MARVDDMRPVLTLPPGESQGRDDVLTLPRGDGARWSCHATRERRPAMPTTELPGVIAEHIAAVNAFDIGGVVATFAPDAYVNDARREITGVDAIRRWVAKE